MTERVREAIAAITAGGMVLVADDADRENEGDLIMAAGAASAANIAFFLRYGSGIICAPMSAATADALELPLMVSRGTDPLGTAFTVSVDDRNCGTGISASDRALTLRTLADPTTAPGHLRRPGHVFPLRARPGGVLKRAGHTEAACDLVSLAGRGDVGAITELVRDDGVTMSGADLTEFAERHDIPYITVADLVRFRRRTERLVEANGTGRIPTRFGEFTATAYRSTIDDVEHLAFTYGDLHAADAGRGVLVRVHSECTTGDIFGSLRCDCGKQLADALELIAREGAGVLVYLRGHEGRGIGLGPKLRAYALQDAGRDTVDANLELGLPIDTREYGIGAAILSHLGVHRLRLITNNPRKYGGLDGFDLEVVERVRMSTTVCADNIAYLTTKRDRMGHLLDLPPELVCSSATSTREPLS
ncbi:bifunctional 3,4-dihydroxy-2-butanone-4-phosphate synthase/GTP cyclohydrolase II [Dactylosporangium sp. NPDC050688]|uniref:bifunctional 3,4-dihydroxy-2-butanone-4-phosphate synthase/GTP cyclohydrolase II n=1 Tax=Dactylosporangium sp. NPDC050688 TaxID=3157217 RepID=UPI0033C36FE7